MCKVQELRFIGGTGIVYTEGMETSICIYMKSNWCRSIVLKLSYSLVIGSKNRPFTNLVLLLIIVTVQGFLHISAGIMADLSYLGIN